MGQQSQTSTRNAGPRFDSWGLRLQGPRHFRQDRVRERGWRGLRGEFPPAHGRHVAAEAQVASLGSWRCVTTKERSWRKLNELTVISDPQFFLRGGQERALWEGGFLWAPGVQGEAVGVSVIHGDGATQGGLRSARTAVRETTGPAPWGPSLAARSPRHSAPPSRRHQEAERPAAVLL